MKATAHLSRILPRALLMLIVAVTLLGGLGSGLARLGWQMDPFSMNWMMLHGPLMICGFLGTLICLERAVALAARSQWNLAVPVVNAAGALALLVLPDPTLAKVLLTASSMGLLGMFIFLLRLHPVRYMAVMTAGAVCWVIGNALWLAGQPIFQVVHLWTAFLILTIVGERLELTRVRRLTPTIENSLVVAVAIYLAGVLLTIVNLGAGIRLLGAGALLMAIWLLRYDITRYTIRRDGLARFIAACLMIGYVWLGVGGVIALWKGAVYAGADYAALLHVFLLGFVFSMIFGHAAIILPAVTGVRLDYRPIFYGHLILLHTTLIYRTYGHLAHDLTAQRWGGLLNVVAVLLFLAMTVLAVIQSNRGQPMVNRSKPVVAA
ncbi:MAG: hypothetical protein IT328_10745 [Caldilineaceae bacterium]|nr:hypothetical protein [Caldilineaceae bacterium]